MTHNCEEHYAKPIWYVYEDFELYLKADLILKTDPELVDHDTPAEQAILITLEQKEKYNAPYKRKLSKFDYRRKVEGAGDES